MNNSHKMGFTWPERKLYTTSRGHQYSFVYIPAPSAKKTLLFLHGFPSNLHDWEKQVQKFTSEGYGAIIPDLLGYGNSSKPLDAAEYKLKPMSNDIIELLDALNQDTVVGIGHDFGATLLSRAVTYHPGRWSELVFLSVGPPRMGTPFELDMINKMTKDVLGFEYLGYIAWMTRDPGAQRCLEDHAASAMSLVFCADHEQWRQWYRPEGRMKQFVSEDQRLEIGKWYPGHLQCRHLEAFGTEEGYRGAVNWYQMWTQNLFSPDEEGLEETTIDPPVLFIGDKESSTQSDMLKTWASQMKVATVDGGHWIHLECDEAVNETIGSFIP